jgi:protein-S-isoprenylcysteine O-methyltransferase Ste14
MGASWLEYRFRLAILVAIAGLGFWAPWIDDPDIGGHTPALYWLIRFVCRMTHIPIGFTAPALLVLVAAMAGAGAVLRIWGAAWHPPFVYNYKSMTTATRAIEGPYLCLRHPKATGAWLILTTASLLMPIGGAFVAIALFTLLLARLIRREEYYLTAELGSRYRNYCNTVPGFIPHFLFLRRAPTQTPLYGRAILTEIGSIGIFLTISCLSWSRDNRMLIVAAAISFAAGLIVKLILPPRQYDGKTVK